MQGIRGESSGKIRVRLQVEELDDHKEEPLEKRRQGMLRATCVVGADEIGLIIWLRSLDALHGERPPFHVFLQRVVPFVFDVLVLAHEVVVVGAEQVA